MTLWYVPAGTTTTSPSRTRCSDPSLKTNLAAPCSMRKNWSTFAIVLGGRFWERAAGCCSRRRAPGGCTRQRVDSGKCRTRSVFKTAQRTLADANVAGPLRQLVLVLLRTRVSAPAIRERRPSAQQSQYRPAFRQTLDFDLAPSTSPDQDREKAGYRQGQAVVCPGDLLVLYSDGVVEAENAASEQFDGAASSPLSGRTRTDRQPKFEMKS